MVLFTTVVFGFIMRIWHKIYNRKEEENTSLSLELIKNLSLGKSNSAEERDVEVYTHPSHHEE